MKRKHVDLLFREAVSTLPDAALAAELSAHSDKYLDYFRRLVFFPSKSLYRMYSVTSRPA